MKIRASFCLHEKAQDLSPAFIPVYRPLLPPAKSLAPFLALLDQSRRYANYGELTKLLEARLIALFGDRAAGVVSASSGTAALIGAILAIAGRATDQKPICLIAGYTFVATALAAEQCGYRVHFVDVEEQTWALDPERLIKHPLLDRAGVVLVTAPYGRPISQASWTRFFKQTGVPVVIDAAAGIECLADHCADVLGSVPVVLSLHATKVFAVGEGGAIVCCDLPLLKAARTALNFGFAGTRETSGPGFNGKMSEYHAAVGLAELDGWSVKRANLRHVAATYRDRAAEYGLCIHAAPNVSSCYVLFDAASEEESGATQSFLERRGIDCRLWYGYGLHRQPYFRAAAHDPLPVTEALAPRLIGIPVAADLSDAAIERIVTALAESRAVFRKA
jgi:dTDP-4-amino-4,6-dideoxygalactose transaminase